MSKYIIEVEDVPFSKIRIDADNGVQNINLYRAKGFNSLVFDKNGLDKLTPLEKELDDAYQKGLEEGKKQAKVQAHLDVCHDIERVAHGNYQKGLDDAWEAARKICLGKEDGGISNGELLEIFKVGSDYSALKKYTASEALAKLREYEQQKADAEIKVGDEVKYRTDDCGVVTWIYGNDAYVLWRDGSTGNYAADELIKTGRHFNFLASLLNAMKEGAE